MQKENQKHSGVVFLLFHGLLFNLIILPTGLLFSILFKADYVSMDEWVNSICLNLGCWQMMDYALASSFLYPTQIGLKQELKKFSFILSINQWFQKKITTPGSRYTLFHRLFWLFIIIILVVPTTSKLIFDFRMPYTSLKFTFVLIQLLCLVYFYLQKKYQDDVFFKKEPIPSPWILELLFLSIFKTKKS